MTPIHPAALEPRPSIVESGKHVAKIAAREALAAERGSPLTAALSPNAIPQRSEFSADSIAPTSVHAPSMHAIPGTAPLTPIQGRRTAPMGNQSVTHNPPGPRASFNKLGQRMLPVHDAAFHRTQDTTALGSARVEEKIFAQVLSARHLADLDKARPPEVRAVEAPRVAKQTHAAPRFARNVTREHALLTTIALARSDTNRPTGVALMLAAFGEAMPKMAALARNASREVLTAVKQGALPRTEPQTSTTVFDASATQGLVGQIMSLAKQAAFLQPLSRLKMAGVPASAGALADAAAAATRSLYRASGRLASDAPIALRQRSASLVA